MTKKIQKGFKFQLKQSPEQASLMSQYAGANRLVWNMMLARNLYRLEHRMPLMWYFEMDFWVKFWKKSDDLPFLKDAPSQTYQQTLKNLQRAFKDGFDKTQPNKRIPIFKKKYKADSFCFPQGFEVDQVNGRIKLPKLGWIRYYNSRHVPGIIKNVTVSKRAGEWYVSMQSEQVVDQPVHPSTSAVGIDLGVKIFAALSDGSTIEPVNAYRKRQERLAMAQVSLSRRVKFSKNWRKQKTKVSQIHADIANTRRDMVQKTSTIISKNHAMIFVEDLKTANMSRSAKGTVDQPGRNVRAKSGLNKSILDQGWGMFVECLTYKQDHAGGDLLKVPAAYTSQTCPHCGHIDKRNRSSQSVFLCVSCGYGENADYVASLNISERGHRLLACIDRETEVAGTGAR